MNFDWVLLGQFAIGIFSVINPIGGIPIFLSLASDFEDQEKRRMTTITAITIFITMVISIFVGKQILGFFGISITSFRFGGGLLIGMMAFKMLRAEGTPPSKMSQREIDSVKSARMDQLRELGVVPLGIPLFAGPGTISTCIIYSAKLSGWCNYLAAIAIALIIALVIKLLLTFSQTIKKTLGRVGLNVLSRVMGLILLAISVELITYSLGQMFPKLLS
ncbi:NAAT family transporter [Bacteriovoracaceae bacterium]|nr:NAAT family transporter [Bacteriovoracaceae bacterium]